MTGQEEAQKVTVNMEDIAPYGEEETREFMGRQAARYKPNFFWKLHKTFGLKTAITAGLLIFLVYVASNYPTGDYSKLLWEAVIYSAAPIFLLWCFVEAKALGPTEWHFDEKLGTYDARDYRVSVQHLRQKNSKRNLATVTWLIFKNKESYETWRAISRWELKQNKS